MLDNYYMVTTIALISFYFSAILPQTVSNNVKLPDWDYLMFSQRWPISSCIEWEDKSKKNVCNLPKDPNSWTVHGIWPTKNGTDGPNDCKSAIHFDPEQLAPLFDALSNHWANIEGNTKNFSFWSHEWDKHGTCASSLPQLNSVYNYFSKGLELNVQYNLNALLSKNNIEPNVNNYTINDFVQVIQKELNVIPQLHCVSDSKTKESLISEIRLCLNKDFEVLNCTDFGLQLSDCSKKKPIKYLKEVPGEMASATIDVYFMDPREIISREEQLQEWYILVKFLMWFTL